MTWFNSGGQPVPKWTTLDDDSATDVLGFVSPRYTMVLSIWCTETAGNTPNLTIEVYDGTTSYALRKEKAMTAKETVVIDEPFPLNQNQTIRVTSSATGGGVDVMVVYLLPTLGGARA